MRQEPGVKFPRRWYIRVLLFNNASASALPRRGMAYIVDRPMTNDRTKNQRGTTRTSRGEERREGSWKGRRYGCRRAQKEVGEGTWFPRLAGGCGCRYYHSMSFGWKGKLIYMQGVAPFREPHHQNIRYQAVQFLLYIPEELPAVLHVICST